MLTVIGVLKRLAVDRAVPDDGGLRPAALGAGMLVGYQLLPLPAALLALVGFAAVAARWPIAAVIAVVVALPYNEVLRPISGGWGFAASEVGAVICIAVVGSQSATRWWRTARRPRNEAHARVGLVFSDYAAALLVFLAVVSLGVSLHEWESLRSFRQTVVEPVLLYGAVALVGGGRRTARQLLVGIVVAGVLVSLVGLYQYVANQNIITAEESLRRIRGFYGSPNQLGLFLGRALPVALALGLAGGAYRRWCLVALAPIGLALALTFSIGGWVGAFCAVVAVVLFRERRVIVGSTVGLLAAGMVALPFLLRIERVASHLDFSDGTTFLRFQLWLGALNLVWDHPLFGVGLDNFLYYYRDLGYMLPGGWREPSLSHPHNFALDFWLSLGLAGLVLIVALLYRYFRDARRLALDLSGASGAADRGLAIALFALMVDFVAHGSIDASYFRPDLAVLFWLSLAILRLLQATAPRSRAAAVRTGIAPTGAREDPA